MRKIFGVMAFNLLTRHDPLSRTRSGAPKPKQPTGRRRKDAAPPHSLRKIRPFPSLLSSLMNKHAVPMPLRQRYVLDGL
jgi:hypothetical protein